MKALLIALAPLAGQLVSAAHAATVPVGTYALHNHPDGNSQPPRYGLRIDELIDVSGGDDRFTFDFDDARSSMRLDYDGSSVRIHGVSWGGRDTGSSYGSHAALWTIDFTYDVGVGTVANGGLNDVRVSVDRQNFGTLSSSYGAWDMRDFMVPSFFFGDEGGGGHRGAPGLSGWGWLEVRPAGAGSWNPHVDAQDWLFTATLLYTPSEVPLPAAGWLFASALGLLGAYGSRRRRSS